MLMFVRSRFRNHCFSQLGVTTPLVGREINLLAHDQHVKGGRRVIKILAAAHGTGMSATYLATSTAGAVRDAPVTVERGKFVALRTRETKEALG